MIENYSDSFWQQGQPDYDSEKLEPVPCVEGWYVLVKFDLVLNGTAFEGEHVLYAQEMSKTHPLFFDAIKIEIVIANHAWFKVGILFMGRSVIRW